MCRNIRCDVFFAFTGFIGWELNMASLLLSTVHNTTVQYLQINSTPQKLASSAVVLVPHCSWRLSSVHHTTGSTPCWLLPHSSDKALHINRTLSWVKKWLIYWLIKRCCSCWNMVYSRITWSVFLVPDSRKRHREIELDLVSYPKPQQKRTEKICT